MIFCVVPLAATRSVQAEPGDQLFKLITGGVASIVWERLRDEPLPRNLSTDCSARLQLIANQLRVGSLSAFKCKSHLVAFYCDNETSFFSR